MEVLVLMPNYVTKALRKFQHPTQKHAQYSLHQWTWPKYGATKQLATPLDTSPPLPEEQKRRIQKYSGTFLYYTHDVECTILPALNALAEQQSNRTKTTEAAITHFLYYSATNSFAIFQYKSSNMILHIEGDASYLSEPRECIRTGWHYCLRSLTTDTKKSPNVLPP